jgi:hypothetical protein
MTTTFTCKFCNWNVTQIYPGDDPEEDTCVLCKWINTNKNLTEAEKHELRIRYSKAIRNGS